KNLLNSERNSTTVKTLLLTQSPPPTEVSRGREYSTYTFRLATACQPTGVSFAMTFRAHRSTTKRARLVQERKSHGSSGLGLNRPVHADISDRYCYSSCMCRSLRAWRRREAAW